jgi:hypothetical protein
MTHRRAVDLIRREEARRRREARAPHDSRDGADLSETAARTDASGNEGRTAATQARHRDLPPAAAVVELEAAAEAVDREVVSRGEAGLDDRIDWFGGPAAVRVR